MNHFAAALILAAASVTAGAEDDPKKVLEVFKGEWKVTSMTVGRTDLPKEKVKDAKAVFDGEMMTLSGAGGNGKDAPIKMALDPKNDPPTVDLTFTQGGKDVTVPGIYKLE